LNRSNLKLAIINKLASGLCYEADDKPAKNA
jgi:hypothetical protein